MPQVNSFVQFIYGPQAKYDALAVKDANTIYFCTDTARMFLGGEEFTRPVQHGAAVPASKNPPNSFFLVEGDEGNELHYSQDGTAWVKIAALPKNVTAGVFGQAAATTLDWGGKFTIPKITIDSNGYAVAGSNIEVTLPTETPLSVETEGEGNAIQEITVSGHKMTLKNPITFATEAKLTEELGKYVPATGGAFTGPVVVTAPAADMNPATKAYVDQAIAGMTHFDYQIVTELPAIGVKGTIYLMSNAVTSGNNVFDEYLWITQGETSQFEKVGSLDIDLSGYAKLTDLPVASDTAAKPAGAAAAGTDAKYARADHVHPVQESVSGNAGTATKLETVRKIGVEGALTAEDVNFDGSGDAKINVTAVDGTKVTGKVAAATAADTAAEATHATDADTADEATHATSADAATKATQDGDGNVIKDTYATKSELSSQRMTWQTFAD